MAGRWRWMGLCALALGACTSDPGFTGVAGVREAEAAEVAACAYVSNIGMTPGVFGPLAEEGLAYAPKKVIQSALEDGANTVVFEKVTPGTMVTRVTATAYRC